MDTTEEEINRYSAPPDRDPDEGSRTAEALIQSLRRGLLRVSLAADGLDEALDRQLAALRAAVRDTTDARQISALVEEIAQTLLRMDAERERAVEAPRGEAKAGWWPKLLSRGAKIEPAPESDAAAIADVPEQVRHVLIRLLSQLSLPPDFAPRAERLRGRLQTAFSLPQLPALLEDVAALVLESTREESAEIEEFLRQLTDRLASLQGYLQASDDGREAAQTASRELNEAIRAQVQGIQTSLHAAPDLDHLKRDVSRQLDRIVSHMAHYQETRARLNADAERRIQELQAKLHETERETDQLRTSLLQQQLRAQVDTLTGVGNREAYNQRLAYEVARWQRHKHPLSLIVGDIDRFKEINDRFGHSTGDKVLRSIARTLHANMRQTDFLARYGGEEFVILLPDTDLAAAGKTAEKLRQAVESRPFHAGADRLPITISFGVAEFATGEAADTVFNRADKALYTAKSAGRNKVASAPPPNP